ncbi:MAG TPA: glycosyltransferase family 87 protein [Sphingomicrobium sp.]|nr:glycosyltransferase family 87 protein [Sphingomicrobium sp.]
MADPFAPYRRVGWAMAALIGLMALAEFTWNWVQPSGRDFISFWGASQFALSGQPAMAYDNQALHALQSTIVAFEPGGEMPFPYAPFFLLLVMPFGLASFPLGLILWSLAGYALYLLVARRVSPTGALLAAAFPPVFANAAIGQNGFVIAGLFLGGLALIERRPFLAGAVLGCLILKPQLALMLPVAMLAGKHWQVIGGAVFSSILVIIAGFLIFGPAATAAWLDQLSLYAIIARDGLVGWHKFVSIYAAGRQVGLSETLAFVLHGAVALGAAIAVWRIWRSGSDWPARFAILAAATMLASPYLYVYDALILLPAFAYLIDRRVPAPFIALAWLLPIATIVQVASGSWPVNVGPLPAVILTILVWREWSKAGVAAERPHATSAMIGN